MRLRAYKEETVFSLIQNGIQNEGTHNLWCAGMFQISFFIVPKLRQKLHETALAAKNPGALDSLNQRFYRKISAWCRIRLYVPCGFSIMVALKAGMERFYVHQKLFTG